MATLLLLHKVWGSVLARVGGPRDPESGSSSSSTPRCRGLAAGAAMEYGSLGVLDAVSIDRRRVGADPTPAGPYRHRALQHCVLLLASPRI